MMLRETAIIDTTFAHSYECELLRETPNVTDLTHYYFPSASINGGRDGLLVKIRPEKGVPWLATFAFGQIARDGISGVFAMPDPAKLCVVSKGEGYVVSATDPTTWELVRASPIMDVRPIRASGVIVFADYTTLIAYDLNGVKWETAQISWDNLRITEVTDTSIRGEFWDIRTEAIANFVVDLANGSCQGGIKGG